MLRPCMPTLDDYQGSSCPPVPDTIPVPPSFLIRATCTNFQRETQYHSQAFGSAYDAERTVEALAEHQRTRSAFHHTQQGHKQRLPTVGDEPGNYLGDLVSSRSKASRPPKHIREESKCIAHETHQLLSSSAPMDVSKERLRHLMGPMCTDQKNIDYTMSVLRAICSDYIDTLEAILGGEEFARECASVSSRRSAPHEFDTNSHQDSYDVPRSAMSADYRCLANRDIGRNAGWHSSPPAGTTTVFLRWSV